MLALALVVGDGDRDDDGVPDAADACPDEPGLAEDGCPPRDRDGDHVLDRVDGCPDEPGPRANSGCPDGDLDADGVVDRLDRCPDRRGDAARQGCPAPDTDGDLVPDERDRCRDRAEVYDGVRDDDGCPDRGPALVILEGDALVLVGPPERAAPVAAALLRRIGARGARAVVVADHGLSYGDSIQRARTVAAVIERALVRAGFPADRLRIEPRGPDGTPRAVITWW